MWTCGLQIRVAEGAAKGKIYILDSPEVKIGRGDPGQVRLVGQLLILDDTVSRVQAELNWVEETQKYTLFNRSETNPTQVNDVVVAEAVLEPGDQIRMGRCVLDLQQADFRFGGKPGQGPPRARGAMAPPLPPEHPTTTNLKHARRDLDQETDITVKVSKVALTTRPSFKIEILAGPMTGQQIPITGLTMALGGPLDPDATPLDKNSKWFDQEIVFSETELPPRCLALSWKELTKAFELHRTVDTQLEISVVRRLDNMDWLANLPYDVAGLLRPGDAFQIGPNVLRVSAPPE